MHFFFSSRGDAQDDDSDDDDEEEEEEEEGEEDEVAEGPSSVAEESELTRTERRELKKQAGEKANKATDGDVEGDDDDLIANPNHVTKKLNISDLSAPRELTRRERYVPVPMSHAPVLLRSHYSPLF